MHDIESSPDVAAEEKEWLRRMTVRRMIEVGTPKPEAGLPLQEAASRNPGLPQASLGTNRRAAGPGMQQRD